MGNLSGFDPPPVGDFTPQAGCVNVSVFVRRHTMHYGIPRKWQSTENAAVDKRGKSKGSRESLTVSHSMLQMTHETS